MNSSAMRLPIITQSTPVILYTRDQDLFPGYTPRQLLPETTILKTSNRAETPRHIQVSLVAVAYNEEESLPGWLESLLTQSRLPDEVVFLNNGSTDGTLKILEQFTGQCPFPFRIITTDRLNIAAGRNHAIRQAKYPVIACTDLGVRLHPDWLARIVYPFVANAQTQVAAGWVTPIQERPFSRRLVLKSFKNTHPQDYLPTSNTIAFTRQAWELAGGYPEWLTLSGEDTQFALALKQTCPHWAFVPEAIVEWDAPDTPKEYWLKIRYWSRGNGETRYNQTVYRRSLMRLCLWTSFVIVGWVAFALSLHSIALSWAWFLIALPWLYLGTWLAFKGKIFSPFSLWVELGAEFFSLWGFYEGLRTRTKALARKYVAAKGLFVILPHVPLDDIGGGPRWTQITLELLSQGYAVSYFYVHPKTETKPLDLYVYHPLLESNLIRAVNPRAYMREYAEAFTSQNMTALVELPMRHHLPLLRQLKKNGVRIIYDLLDDWRTPLGGRWYKPYIERKIIGLSDQLIASETSLQKWLEKNSDRQVHLLPNAVNRRLFDPNRSYQRPLDLPVLEWISIYTGSLWGDWFDWDLLVQLARAYPRAGVVVIGDYRGNLKLPPGNLFFLGLRPQFTLPAYLAHSDVAIIPRLVKPATQGMNPLKVYEYLALHKPVVATNLSPLEGIPGVHFAATRSEFIRRVEEARNQPVPIQQIETFLAQNTWTQRVEQLLNISQLS